MFGWCTQDHGSENFAQAHTIVCNAWFTRPLLELDRLTERCTYMADTDGLETVDCLQIARCMCANDIL